MQLQKFAHLESVASKESFARFTGNGVEVVTERFVAADETSLVLRLLRLRLRPVLPTTRRHLQHKKLHRHHTSKSITLLS